MVLIDLRPYCRPIQLGWIRDACQTFSLLDAVETRRNVLGLPALTFSREWLYARASLMAAWLPVFQVSTDIGLVETWANGDPKALDTVAGAHKVKWKAISGSPYQTGRVYHQRIVEALKAKNPVVWGLFITHAWDNPGSNVIPRPSDGRFYTAHQITIVGDNDELDAYLIRNMWGGGWGMGGYAWLSRDYLAEGYGYSAGSGSVITEFLDAPTGTTVTFDETLAAVKQPWTDAQRQILMAALAVPSPLPVPPTTGISPDGTTMPPATSIVDSNGTWTLDRWGIVSLNGQQQISSVTSMQQVGGKTEATARDGSRLRYVNGRWGAA